MKKRGFKIFLSLLLLLSLLAALLCVAAGCDEKEEKPLFVEEDTFYAFDNISLMGMDLSGVMPLVLPMLTEDSGLTLRANGEFDIKIALKENMAAGLNPIISAAAGGPLGVMLADFDLGDIVSKYAEPIFPGFTLSDVKGSLELVKNSVGFSLDLDYEDEIVKNLIASLEETGHVSEDFAIPQKLGLLLHGIYEIRTVKALVEGQEVEYRAVFIGKMPENGEPFMCFTESTDENGNTSMHLRVEFLQLDMNFVKPAVAA